MFILNLPVIIVAVPPGSLPLALSLANSLSMPHFLSTKKRKQNMVGQIGRYVGVASIVFVITQEYFIFFVKSVKFYLIRFDLLKQAEMDGRCRIVLLLQLPFIHQITLHIMLAQNSSPSQ